MRPPKFLLIAALAGGLFSSQAFAGVVTYAGYSHDTATDIVTGDGLEWMQWDVTANQSISATLGTYAGNGWRLASNAEMSRLFNSFSFGMVFDTDENTRQTSQFMFPDLASENEVTNKFISMFGDTFKAGGGTFGSIDDPYESSGAYFGEDGDGDGLYNFASLSDDYFYVGGFGETPVFAFATIAEDFQTDSSTNASFGVALVREVPSPSTIVLIALGLAALSFTRRPSRLLQMKPCGI